MTRGRMVPEKMMVLSKTMRTTLGLLLTGSLLTGFLLGCGSSSGGSGGGGGGSSDPTSPWTEITGDANWSDRYLHSSVVFDDKMWVLGGSRVDNVPLSDVWSSTDGATWTMVAADPWQARGGHASVVFDGKMWMLGGFLNDSLETSNGVWSSANGVDWTPENAAPGWMSRGLHAAVVFQDKLWVLGGAEELTELNDVWSSTDGIAWIEETASAPWSARGGHTVLVFEDELWLLGGGAGRDDEFQVMNDVWTSADGVNWTEESVSVPWSVRGGHTAVVYQDRLWVLGGASYQGEDGKALADAWSYAGGEWREEEDVAWPARGGHTSVVFREELWVMGGVQGEGDLLMGADFAETLSDVWSRQ